MPRITKATPHLHEAELEIRRTAYRRHERPEYAEHRIGFRCAADAP